VAHSPFPVEGRNGRCGGADGGSHRGRGVPEQCTTKVYLGVRGHSHSKLMKQLCEPGSINHKSTSRHGSRINKGHATPSQAKPDAGPRRHCTSKELRLGSSKCIQRFAQQVE
jgi:hypothetical protein